MKSFRAALALLILSLLISVYAGICHAQSDQQTIAFKTGFNFISFTLKPDKTAQQLIAGDTSLADIYLYSAASGSFISAGEGVLSALNAGKGYIIKANADATVVVSGQAAARTGDISLKAGFNLVGFSRVPAAVKFSELLSRNSFILGMYKWSSSTGCFFQVVRNASGLPDQLDGVDPAVVQAQAYFIKLSSDATLNYDSGEITFISAGGDTVTPAQPVVPTPSEIAAGVQSNKYKEFFTGLPVNQGSLRGYDTEKKPQAGLLATRSFISDRLASILGAGSVTSQEFTTPNGYQCVNIAGTLQGKNADGWRYIISCHYDSEQTPGANDDGTGVASVLEAARVMSGYKFNDTIIFLFLDYEEERESIFAQGSLFYCQQNKAYAPKVKAAISVDMIGFHAPGDNSFSLSRADSNPGTASETLLKEIESAFLKYTTLAVGNRLPGENASDAFRFYGEGYASVLITERLNDSGWPINQYYHKDSDFYLDQSGATQKYNGNEYIDIDYAAQITKGVVGWAAEAAVPAAN